ncbi:hypothetical protein WH47_08057 [Habropoda laboriosa]|uniref:Histone-lysine N-methyltransferase SETMAR n=1 Tax=Habropoda laboriosa TaxID=597456 RepID=A0A0L7QPN1_9HYME|nr:hypothetical protein WH47_08057 [Habropoda laboriosa]
MKFPVFLLSLFIEYVQNELSIFLEKVNLYVHLNGWSQHQGAAPHCALIARKQLNDKGMFPNR